MSDLASFVNQFESAIDGIEPGSISGDTVLDSLQVWDSLALLSVLAIADAEYGVTVSGIEVRDCKTVADIHKLILSKKG
jgi:acyl carrier protein